MRWHSDSATPTAEPLTSGSLACPADEEQETLVGESAALQGLRDAAASVAERRSTVLLLGETGTGKEMLARYIHDCSDRRDEPFIPVDCSALSETLFESQLFGHVRGAFTGAIRESLGFIRAAHGGTLFLDEIGELPLSQQAKLLRVIQERAVVPVGDTKALPVDVRLVVATHRDLSQMVRDGQFRQDLYFRLNVITLGVPPLRERADDVLPLARHFLAAQSALYGEPLKTLSAEAATRLKSYPWPGNVRELANAIEHAYVVAAGDVVRIEHLPERLRKSSSSAQMLSDLCLADVERRTIAEALSRTKGCKSAACQLLGINVQKLNRRLDKLGIEVPRR